MNAEEDLDEIPAPLDGSTYVRPALPLGVVEVDGLRVRRFAPGTLPTLDPVEQGRDWRT